MPVSVEDYYFCAEFGYKKWESGVNPELYPQL